ncbi:hypothetical protein ACIBJI_32340, partial [Nocardia sp. NPDC050408]
IEHEPETHTAETEFGPPICEFTRIERHRVATAFPDVRLPSPWSVGISNLEHVLPVDHLLSVVPRLPVEPAFAYLLAELVTVTATVWKTAYSFRHDTISDLGITTCTPNMCSPMHLVINATFVALGSLTIVGAIGFRDYIPHGPRQYADPMLFCPKLIH